MAIYGAFDISGSGLQAQRVRMDAISANLANRNTPGFEIKQVEFCLLYTSPSPRDGLLSRMPSSA